MLRPTGFEPLALTAASCRWQHTSLDRRRVSIHRVSIHGGFTVIKNGN